jgi:AraC-like DNA-binding protein
MSNNPIQTVVRYGETAPSRAIAEWVEAIWWIRGDVGAADGARVRWHDVLPDGCADWIVQADDGGGARSFFVGPMTRRLSVPMAGGRANWFGIRFRPGALGGVLRVPLVEMRDGMAEDLPLPVVASGVGRLVDAVAGGTAPGELAGVAERLLVRWHGLRGAREDAARAVRAVAVFAARNEDATVARIAANAGMSVRTLRRVFDSAVGVSPKFFARVLRVQDVIAVMRLVGRRGGAVDWAGVAAGAGFADQAHLVREFREFTGWTPGAYLGALKNGRFLQYGRGG